MSNFYSPLRYPGGKNCIFKFMSNFFYENNLIGISYAEPFAGGAGLALRLLFNEYVSHIYINDYDQCIYAFWETVLTKNEEFCDWISNLEVTIENWHYYKEVQKNAAVSDNFELAKSTFFLNRTNISGVIKGGVIGGYKQTGKYKIDARFNKKSLISRIKRITELKHRITISNLDGLDFIKNINERKESTFIYMDPPYYIKGADLYMNFFKDRDHEILSQEISKITNNWMVSYDNHPFILNLYPERNKILYQLSQSASNRVGDEVLIFSDNLLYIEAMSQLKSPIAI